MFGRPGYAFVVSLCFQKKEKEILMPLTQALT